MKKLFYLSIVFCALFYADYSNSAPIYYGSSDNMSFGQILARDAINNVTWAFLTRKRDNPPATSNNMIYVPPRTSANNYLVNHTQFTCHYCPNKKDLKCELTKNLECCECLEKYFGK